MNWAELRTRMVEREVIGKGIRNERVIKAMLEIPRHLFLEEALWSRAYSDLPLPIGFQQTISRPYIVSLMTELLDPQPTDNILEIGTGSGYQGAVLSKIAAKVYTIERIPELIKKARRILARLKIQNVFVKEYDGSLGWPEVSPFQGIIVTAASKSLPSELMKQLNEGGNLVIPLQEGGKQVLKKIKKTTGKPEITESHPCTFVPLVESRQ